MRNILLVCSVFTILTTTLLSFCIHTHNILEYKDNITTIPLKQGKPDPKTGLIFDVGFTEVKQNCTVCHSARLIIQNCGSRKEWKEIITWMQKEQNLWLFDKHKEKIILDYLAGNYPQPETYRRKPLPQHLLPKFNY